VVLRLPRADLAPGTRRLDATTTEAGLPVGRDSIGLTVVPRVTPPAAALATGTPVTLDTLHAAPDVEVFLDGAALASASVAFASPTQVDVTLPAATPAGTVTLMLRAGKVAGPEVEVTVA
jgi:uncharacterized protein (TIGR03437 family)